MLRCDRSNTLQQSDSSPCTSPPESFSQSSKRSRGTKASYKRSTPQPDSDQCDKPRKRTKATHNDSTDNHLIRSPINPASTHAKAAQGIQATTPNRGCESHRTTSRCAVETWTFDTRETKPVFRRWNDASLSKMSLQSVFDTIGKFKICGADWVLFILDTPNTTFRALCQRGSEDFDGIRDGYVQQIKSEARQKKNPRTFGIILAPVDSAKEEDKVWDLFLKVWARH